MLWSLRTGVVSSQGVWPEDVIETVVQRLMIPASERQRVEAALAQGPRRGVLLSTCSLGSGDSGGPIVNEQGQLIGVSFGIPNDGGDPLASGGFAYHVHLDEVNAFLQRASGLFVDSVPPPPPFVPDPWPVGLFTNLKDFDGDGVPDTLLFAMDPQAGLTGVLFDLDQSSPLEACVQAIQEGVQPPWEFEVAMQATPFHRTFMDRNNDGRLDLMLVDQDNNELVDVIVVTDTNGAWKVAPLIKLNVAEPTLLTDKAIQERFAAILKNINAQ
jgi:hypothetical protein